MHINRIIIHTETELDPKKEERKTTFPIIPVEIPRHVNSWGEWKFILCVINYPNMLFFPYLSLLFRLTVYTVAC